MKSQIVKVTTTYGFEGFKIEEYLEPITANVVVGMNLFKDFLGGLTDIFGGKSKSYQNTLSSINDEVINKLRKKAYAIGANCILGLKIDNDEISSQGKSMMMVTAFGTAARANFTKIKSNINKIKAEIINVETFNFLKQKKEYIKNIQKKSFVIDANFWEFVKSNRVDEIANHLLDKYIHFIESVPDYDYNKDEITNFSNQIKDYFTLIDSEIAINVIYNKLLLKLKSNTRKKLINLTVDLKLLDFPKVIELIKNPEFQIKKSGILILQAEKLSYEKTDIQLIEKLISFIKGNFNERGKISAKKKALSSKQKEIWICECGKENIIEKKYCSLCNKDIYGFFQNELNPKQAVDKLQNELDILKIYLG